MPSNKFKQRVLKHCAASLYVVQGINTETLVFASDDRRQVKAKVKEAEMHEFPVAVWKHEKRWTPIYNSTTTPGLFH